MLVEKLQRASGRVIKNGNLSTEVQMAVYMSVLLPTLLYGSES